MFQTYILVDIKNKLAKFRRCVNLVHFAKLYFGKYTLSNFFAELDNSKNNNLFTKCVGQKSEHLDKFWLPAPWHRD